MDKKFELAVYFAIAITIVFLSLWVFTDTKGETLFVYYIVSYCLSTLLILLAPKKLFQK